MELFRVLIFALLVLSEAACVGPPETTKEQRDFFARDLATSLPARGSVTLLWDYPSNELTGVSFNIYKTDTLSAPFALLTNVSALSVTLPATNGATFYRVKALHNGLESE